MSGIMPLINVPDMVQYGRVQAHLVAFIADTNTWEPSDYRWTKN